MNKYTAIGYHTDNDQPICIHFEADRPDDRRKILAAAKSQTGLGDVNINVCEVVAGHVDGLLETWELFPVSSDD